MERLLLLLLIGGVIFFFYTFGFNEILFWVWKKVKKVWKKGGRQQRQGRQERERRIKCRNAWHSSKRSESEQECPTCGRKRERLATIRAVNPRK